MPNPWSGSGRLSTIFPAWSFAQYPRSSTGMSARRQVLASATPDTPNRGASFCIGSDQTRSCSSWRVKRSTLLAQNVLKRSQCDQGFCPHGRLSCRSDRIAISDDVSERELGALFDYRNRDPPLRDSDRCYLFRLS